MPNYKEKKRMLRELVKKEEEERVLKIQTEGHSFEDTDAFKRSEKHYKYYVHRQTDYSNILKLENLNKKKIGKKQVFEIPFPKGAYLVKNFCDLHEQVQIGFQALNYYINRPYRTNLDGTNGLYESQTLKNLQKNEEVEPVEVRGEDSEVLYYFNENIRMSNLGYQYDWPHRSYPSTKVAVPESIHSLTQRAVSLFNELRQTKLEYQGEAVIVNYYKEKDYMTGHLDDGQIDQKNPIFSFCFGLSCVFLIGGERRDEKPVGILLQAGDLLIMSEYSRICYHGVPRIIENSFIRPKQGLEDIKLRRQKDGKEWNGIEEVLNYMGNHRLNVNVRQVYPNKQQAGQQGQKKGQE